MENKINLPYGGPGAGFKVAELITLLQQRNVDFIIVGSQYVILADHTKPASLDVWLRMKVSKSYSNTRQACVKVINDLIGTGLFVIEKKRCDVTKRPCDALVLKE